MKEDKIKFLYDNGFWWLFLGSLVSADNEKSDEEKKSLLEKLIKDIPESNIPEDIKEKSLEYCKKGLNLL